MKILRIFEHTHPMKIFFLFFVFLLGRCSIMCSLQCCCCLFWLGGPCASISLNWSLLLSSSESHTSSGSTFSISEHKLPTFTEFKLWLCFSTPNRTPNSNSSASHFWLTSSLQWSNYNLGTSSESNFLSLTSSFAKYISSWSSAILSEWWSSSSSSLCSSSSSDSL